MFLFIYFSRVEAFDHTIMVTANGLTKYSLHLSRSSAEKFHDVDKSKRNKAKNISLTGFPQLNCPLL